MNQPTNKPGDPLFMSIDPDPTNFEPPWVPSGTFLSLRDWFAGQALIGYNSTHADPECVDVPEPNTAATWAYDYADAMLATRTKKGGAT